MYLTLLAEIYPELALAETRTLITKGYPGLPDDEYALLEAYCLDPQCDCRRVMLNVNSRRDTEKGQFRYLASIYYGFDRDDELAGPDLDPLNPRSQYAPALLELVEQVLVDPAYVDRLKRHYRLAKKAASDPNSAVRQKVARLLAEDDLLSDKPMAGAGAAAGRRTAWPARRPGVQRPKRKKR